MAKGINKVILVGNVGQDPETRYMPNGTAVTNITLATSEQWKNKENGNQEERTEWHTVVFYQRLAEVVAEYVKKGSKLYIEGSLRTRSWEQDGIKRYKTEIIAKEMQMLDTRGGSRGDDDRPQHSTWQGQSGARDNGPARGQRQPEPEDAFDDDIPF